MLSKSLIALTVVFAITTAVAAQTGGQYDLSQSVIASGGGSNSAGGAYTVDGTAGQTIAGVQSSNASFSVRGGFWAPTSFAPTAAGVSVGGQVLTADGAGIRNVNLTLTNLSTGEIRTALSSAFGYYKFEDIRVGQLYLVSVRSKRYSFEPDSRVINLVDELTDVDFTSMPVE